MVNSLILATWGLVLATLLLFAANLVPALGQFREWRERERSLASVLLPDLHGTRTQATDVRDTLLRLKSDAPLEEITHIYYMVEQLCERAERVQDHVGLSIDQRLELYVLNSHLNLLGLQLSLIASEDENLRQMALEDASIEERLRKSANAAQASIICLDRVDRLFVEVRKKYRGRTFTEEMLQRVELDSDNAEKALVDVRREISRGKGVATDRP
ncbi:hypothetical protein [Streptomyces albogriseolus]|uniref:hypothetical protein n=1 Tax=Streptomyces albogriseolus TaxID=1887 RepID=UPI002258696E|nr:hypothetical protein [Streptomyces viridodiastaticus]MCX4621434.1 hypothetical protein [Streptomyces viridodiastaticus]